MEAAVTGRPVLVADLHHATEMSRWPILLRPWWSSPTWGVLFAVPLQWATINLGVLEPVPQGSGFAERRAVTGCDERRGHGRTDVSGGAHRSR